MYVALIIILLAVAGLAIRRGLQKHSSLMVAAGIILALTTFVFFGLLDLWGEHLWFTTMGYGRRFWTGITARVLCTGAGALLAAVVTGAILWPARKGRKGACALLLAGTAFIGGIWGIINWETILRFLYRVEGATADPILGRNTGFYFFTLPFYTSLCNVLILLVFLATTAVFLLSFIRLENGEPRLRDDAFRRDVTPRVWRPFHIALGIGLLLVAWRFYLAGFHLMYSTLGAVRGAGWTDVHVRLPAYRILALMVVIGAALFLAPFLRRPFERWFHSKGLEKTESHLATLAAPLFVVAMLWFMGLVILPKMTQWLIVEPNEITREKPYIEHNIRFTRLGFGLANVEEREFPVSHRLSRDIIDEEKTVISEVRLWDWRALEQVYKQFQQIRLYYTFHDVDIDRYTLGSQYRPVMLSPREMQLDNLPEQSQTFVNRRFKYTHGYGTAMASVNDFTDQGLPDLLIRDIPPKTTDDSLRVDNPQIYYGELTRTHVLVNTSEQEFDYPSGDENVYINYPGKGGVELNSLFRKFLFGWKFDGTRLLISSYPTRQSRIMFHRQIHERVRRLAPFLRFEQDPYMVIADHRQYWIVDAYTTAYTFPYSEPFSSRNEMQSSERGFPPIRDTVTPFLHRANYVRNSVKAVVDAFSGEVTFYVFDEADPLLKVWRRVFPDLFTPASEMSSQLRAHVRYPHQLLLAQGLVYAKYHMENPEVFYNQEDLWIRATEKYYNQVQPIEPYYIMWELPESDHPEFVLILPFTPKNRQVMIGWIAGMCDGDNLGRLLSFKFPKEKRVLGPQQVETKIDQDSFLSGQLSLWDQRGSRVIRGNVLAIPVADTILYVEPIYLEAETAAYPELRMVAVMHNDNLSYAETFEEALNGLFEGQPLLKDETGSRTAGTATLNGSTSVLASEAQQAFDRYLKLQAEKRFEEAAKSLQVLQDKLEQLALPPTQPNTEDTDQ